jgi:hypothetical protein
MVQRPKSRLDVSRLYASLLAQVRYCSSVFYLQIADQFAVIGKAVNVKHCVITGGMDMVLQGQELSKKPHIVIATPGR